MTKCDTCGVTYGRERSFFCKGDTPHKWFTVGEKAAESADTARDALVKARDVIMASGLECLFKDLSTCIAELNAGRITKNKYCMGCVRREALPAIEAAIAEEGKDAN